MLELTPNFQPDNHCLYRAAGNFPMFCECLTHFRDRDLAPFPNDLHILTLRLCERTESVFAMMNSKSRSAYDPSVIMPPGCQRRNRSVA